MQRQARWVRVSQGIRQAVFDLESLEAPNPDDLSIEKSENRISWNRSFTTPGGEEISLQIFSRYGTGTWDIEFWGMEGYDQSNRGEQWYVLKKILSFIKQFVEEKNPQALKFRGWTEKQHKLYGKMLKRFFPDRAVYEDGGYFYLHAPKEQAWG